jgi:hypothetical protein
MMGRHNAGERQKVREPPGFAPVPRQDFSQVE